MDLLTLKGDIPWINIEGGPCGGKTTALAAICEWCQNHGYTPYIVPEAATALIGSGLNPTSPIFQELVLRHILHAITERMRYQTSVEANKPVLIFDSGLARGQAYVGKTTFNQALDTVGLSLVDARDMYDGVIFLDSAAVGAEEFYTTANNDARSETVEQAQDINQKTLEAWIGTPHLGHIQNNSNQSFDQKIHQAIKHLARMLGEPEPLEIERKFVLHEFDLNRLPTMTTPIDVRQTYLVNKSGVTERVRARGQDDTYLYFHTLKQFSKPGVAIETDRLVGPGQYRDLQVRSMTDKQPILKQRLCVPSGGQYLEIDVFSGHRSGLVMVEAEVADLSDEVVLPDFLGAHTDVTAEQGYSNFALADPV